MKIGDKAIGFKFSCDYYWVSSMEKYIGITGTILKIYETRFTILYDDGVFYTYPRSGYISFLRNIKFKQLGI